MWRLPAVGTPPIQPAALSGAGQGKHGTAILAAGREVKHEGFLAAAVAIWLYPMKEIRLPVVDIGSMQGQGGKVDSHWMAP